MKLVRNKIPLTLLLGTLLLQGCAQNESLSPPANSEKIHFTATIPEELEALPISAMYRSKICRKERRTSNMKPYTVPGFQREKYPLTQLSSNQVMVDIPKDGGGKCEWKLSNINFEVKLKDTAKINPLISKNFGFESTFVFDNNAPQVFDGGYLKSTGDFSETIILFPFSGEYFVTGHKPFFSLVGKDDPSTYKINSANNIHLNIIYEKNILSHWQGRKSDDDISSITYSNGDVVYGETDPNFDKLMKIRESKQAK